MEPAQMSGASIVDQSVAIDSQLLPPSSDHDADAKGCSLYNELEPDAKQQKSSEDNELELDIKRQKSSESLPPTKLCIICSGFYADDEDPSYDVFVAELNSPCYAAFKNKDDAISIAPTFRFKLYHDSKGFCLLGSTLYIFESTDLKGGPERKSVYTIDLSKCDLTKPSLKKLEKSELDRAPDMKRHKKFPYATPTPDGKILVFSAAIYIEPFHKTAGKNDFELYDPVAKTWRKIPGIRYDWSAYYREHYNDLWIFAFTFIDKSTFILQTQNGLMFSLDLGSIDEGWEQKHTFFGARNFPFINGRFFVIDDLLCATPWGAYDIQKERELPEWFCIPLSSDLDLYPGAITLVDDVENGKFNFYSIESGTSTETLYPQFVIHPFSCDLTKYKEDKKKMGDSAELSASMSVGESFNFRYDGQQCHSFITLNMYSF